MRRHGVLGAALAVLTVISGTATVTDTAEAATRTRHDYVANAVRLPTTNTEAAAYARNIDGESGPDNALGQFFATMSAQGLDLSGFQAEAVTSGQLVMLHSLRTASLKSTKTATWQVRYGVPTETPDFSGQGTFTVDPLAARSAKIPAKIKDHHVSTAAATLPVSLDLGAGSVTLSVVKGRIFATCNKSGCTNGRVNGAITKTEVDETFIPGLVAMLQPLVARDCPGPDASSCVDQSAGKTIVSLFDTDDDLVITDQELLDSPLVQTVLAPDVDLFDAEGAPGHDGVADSLSLGIGFTAVRATLG